MPDTTTQDAQVVEPVKGKLTIGVKGLKSPTPNWVTWIFRIEFVATGFITFILAGDPGISDLNKVRIGLYLKGLDMAVWGIGRFVGITKETI